MGTNPGPNPGMALGQKYFAVGLKFAAGIVVFSLAGIWLDRRLGTIPLFTLVGTLGGAVLGFLSVYHDVKRDEQAARDRSEKK